MNNLPRELWGLIIEFSQYLPLRQVCKKAYCYYKLTEEQLDRLSLMYLTCRPPNLKYVPVALAPSRLHNLGSRFAVYKFHPHHSIRSGLWEITICRDTRFPHIRRKRIYYNHKIKCAKFTDNCRFFIVMEESIRVWPVGATYSGKRNEEVWAGFFFYQGNMIDLHSQTIFNPTIKHLNFSHGIVTGQINQQWVKLDVNKYLNRFK